MNDQNNQESNKSDLQTAALASSVVVIVFFIVYWSGQIQSTYELLSLAYGWGQ